MDISEGILDMISHELNKREIKDKINKNIIGPVVSDLAQKYSPYLFVYFLAHFIIIILLIYLVCQVRKYNNNI